MCNAWIQRKIVIGIALFSLSLSACAATQGGESEGGAAGCNAAGDSEVLTNEDDGYCLTYPAGYCQWAMTGEETTLVGGRRVEEEPERCQDDPLLLHGQVVWVSLNVEPAGGRTVEQVVEAYEAELGMNLEAFGIMRLETSLDGEAAVMLDQAPGQELMRLLFAVHDDTLYKMTFVPAGEDRGERYAQMTALYNQVTGSFRFL